MLFVLSVINGGTDGFDSYSIGFFSSEKVAKEASVGQGGMEVVISANT